ncbi:hypothetical protein M413DRAFT_444476 [Hebeloma cylindrosporum]|uniref:Cyclin-domain-containing protein n=1 Tax=Hebeloma cylindrosporum TaxID=76867 RepID=A0A0C3CF56_HEBCY|nr:hypothetical protein M413DRAFT_444476 [Hebeloma cylindrosporum h7]
MSDKFEILSPLELPTPIQASPPPPPPLLSLSSGTLDIHSYPPTELLKLLADFLTDIATANDRLSPSDTIPPLPSSQDPPESIINPSPIWHTLTTGSQNAVSNPASALAFHGTGIPKLSVEAYLLRIHKYCPTTNQVFLSLLVYFDRMSKMFEDAAGRPFVINSFNVHRLIIAGYTVASKLSTDLFYKNSRYSKVGGVPLSELNRLETQFLLLNDFQLFVSTADLQRSAEKLRARAELCLSGPVSSPRDLTPQPVVDPSFQPPRSAVWLSINSAQSDGRKHGPGGPLSWFPLADPTFRKQEDFPDGTTDSLTRKIASPCFQHSPFSNEARKIRQQIRSVSNPNANPIDFEIRKGMKSRRKACHVNSTSESSSAFDTEAFGSSLPESDGDSN